MIISLISFKKHIKQLRVSLRLFISCICQAP